MIKRRNVRLNGVGQLVGRNRVYELRSSDRSHRTVPAARLSLTAFLPELKLYFKAGLSKPVKVSGLA